MRKILIFSITVSILMGFFLLIYREGTLPVDKTNITPIIFVVKKGDRLNEIINNLANSELIRNRVVFYLVIKQLGIEKNIQAGDFRLFSSMDAFEIAKTLTHGTLDVWITIIEGLRKEEIAKLIAQKLDIPEIEFINNADEGYLFPDTYLIPKTATAKDIVSILKNNFEKKYNTLSRTNTTLTKKQIVILASLVEREAKHEEDRQKVADIIFKRIVNGWPLQIDAAIQYALGYQSRSKTWWKTTLIADDLKIKSPYNTYTSVGLPPSPIGNPGLASLKASSNANDATPYWYYLSDKNGTMHYATTLEEHNENIRMYLP